jgi:DNA invertase Pin-like site-specific DNA recombinase
MNDMKKCIIFARCSTLQQFTESQTDVLVKWAEPCGYPPAQQIIIEEQESGIKLKEEERLGINRIKKFIEADLDIDCLFANEISDVHDGSVDTN